MHKELIEILANRGLKIESTIAELSNSPCIDNLNTVIDVEDVKEKHYGLRGMQVPKSVGGLYLTPSDELLFIHPMDYDSNDSSEDFLKKFSHQKILNKVYDTIGIFDDVLGYYGHYQDLRTYLEKRGGEKIKTIVLINLSVNEFLNARLTFGSELNIGTNHPVADDIIIMTCEDFKDAYC